MKIYDILFSKLYRALDAMMYCYTIKDVLRNHTNYGAATAYADILSELGHDVDLKVYGDGEYLITNFISIDGKDYDFFH